MKNLIAVVILSALSAYPQLSACEKSIQGNVTIEICQAGALTHLFVNSLDPQTVAFLVFVRTEKSNSIRLDLPVGDFPSASHCKVKLDGKILHVIVHELHDSDGIDFILPPGGPAEILSTKDILSTK